MGRKIARFIAVAALTALVVVPTGIDMALPWHPWSWYGFFDPARSGGQVFPMDDAARAQGLANGDRLLNPLPPDVSTRSHAYGFTLAPDGAAVTERVATPSGVKKTVRLIAHPWRRDIWDNVSIEILNLSTWLFVGIAAALVLLRPRPATWAFLIFAVCLSTPGLLLYEYLTADWLHLYASAMTIHGLIGIAFLVFALRFPDVRLDNKRASTLEALLIAIYIIVAVILPIAGVGLPQLPVVAIVWAPMAAGVAVMIWRLRHASAPDAARLRWVFAGFVVAALPALCFSVVLPALKIVPPHFVAAYNIATSWNLIAPITVAYAVFKHRLFDLRFVVNRAAVFSGVSVILVGGFVLIEWLLTDWLRDASHATNMIAGAAVALALGLSTRAVHSRVDRAVDTIFFRKSHEDERAIRRFADDAPYITDPGVLVQRTIATLRDHTDAAFVEILLDDGSRRYGTVDDNDEALVRMRARHEPVDLHNVTTQLRGDIAFPMIARGRLAGVLVLGPRESGETYAPDEIAAIADLARTAASTLDVLTPKTDPSRDAVLDGIRALQESMASLRQAIREITEVAPT
ncbi:MAG TPA: hypothetical protein VGZ02_05405 [Candidatus Baltobacteraceae bacterium]|jgi:hypothetical protein|nr:hypothetical protein [Candidatus Baltobacteraceae bacterium]